MEELKSLIEILKDMPEMVIWLVAFYFFFKVVVVGSVYGVLKLLITKAHDAIIAKKTIINEQNIYLQDHVISHTGRAPEMLLELIHRMKQTTGTYIHESDIQRVMEVLDEAKFPVKGK